MSRRSHPYFGQINRLAAAPVVAPGKKRARPPQMTPDEEPGVLWQAIREGSEPAPADRRKGKGGLRS